MKLSTFIIAIIFNCIIGMLSLSFLQKRAERHESDAEKKYSEQLEKACEILEKISIDDIC